jgi:hypothetical protein
MIIQDFKGYQEGKDITKIPQDYLAYPAENVMIYKGKAYKRAGSELFGAVDTLDQPIIGDYTWKDAQPGRMLLRAYGQKLQAWLEPYKTGAGWVDIFTALTAGASKVRFAKWIDPNGSTIHTRLFFVDGSDDFYQWNGGVAKVLSVVGTTITIDGVKTLEALGFDNGAVTTQTIRINGVTYQYNNNPTGQTLTTTVAPVGVVPGDLVIAQPTVSIITLANFNKEHIYQFKNHVVLGNLTSGNLYFSHIANYPIDYTVPLPASRTAATGFFSSLDGNIMAIWTRKDKLWVSTEEDWFKYTKLDTKNAYDLFVEVEKNETTERNGALPHCVTSYKGDTIFIAQDKTLQMITDNDIVQTDSVKLLSDEVATLLQRTNMLGASILVFDRYILIIAPADSLIAMYDIVDNYWQPPQYNGVNSISIFDGYLVGHSSTRNVSFKMFTGRQDLGVDFDAVFATGYANFGNEFIHKQFTKTGISGRMTASCEIKWENLFEENGQRAKLTREIKGTDVKLFSGSDLTPFGSVPFGTTPFAGFMPEEGSDIKRFILLDGGASKPFLEYRPIITISGENTAFEMTGYMIEEMAASRKVGNDHYVKT